MQIPCIDLHGRTKNDAISVLANFLDSQRSSPDVQKAMTDHSRLTPVPVLIITGSGKHSKDGPVLRSAVEKYLKKRQMHFVLNRGKGAFTVDCASGIDLYFDHQQKVCSKVVVLERQHIDQSIKSAKWQSSVRIHMTKPEDSLANYIPSYQRSSKDPLNDNKKIDTTIGKADPMIYTKGLISADTAEEARIRAILEQSKMEQDEKLHIQKMTDQEISDSIIKSQRFISSSVDKSQNDHEIRFLSHLMHERDRREEEEQFLAIIELSRQLEEHHRKEREMEEIAIQRLLKISEQELTIKSCQNNDDDLSEAIARSLKEAASNEYSNEEEERLVQYILEMSMCDM